MIEKVCPICKIKKSIYEYGKYFSKVRNKYRIQNYCNECSKEEKKKRSAEYFLKNREKRLQYARDYRANPKNKEKRKKLEQYFRVKYRKELQNCYVAFYLAKKWGVQVKIIRNIPGLIEVQRANLFLKRTIKRIENEKQNRRPKKPFIHSDRGIARRRKPP